MYGQGGKVLSACTGVAAACAGTVVLPQTGMNTVIQLAIATGAGLVAWAGVYVASAAFGKR